MFPLDTDPEVGLLDHMVILFQIFDRLRKWKEGGIKIKMVKEKQLFVTFVKMARQPLRTVLNI